MAATRTREAAAVDAADTGGPLSALPSAAAAAAAAAASDSCAAGASASPKRTRFRPTGAEAGGTAATRCTAALPRLSSAEAPAGAAVVAAVRGASSHRP
eukprot:scaffold23630_cov33-Phaeocystis_antarctica.AAC.1